jgi:hypothetical protein
MEKLTLKPSRQQRQALVENILAVWDRATPAHKASGMQWYSHAHELALMVGQGDASKGAGVIAAFSANTGWGQNMRLALAKSAGQEVGHLKTVLTKVEAIWEGANPLAVLGNGLKTLNFYLNIFQPDHSGPVTIDRHAHDIARAEVWGSEDRGLSAGTRYAILADAYRDAATLRGVRPHEMQAVTWETWRSEISGTSTRGELH